MGHLCWYEDFEAREKQKPKGVIDLREVNNVYMKAVPGEGGRGEVIHLELDNNTYMFGDAKTTAVNKQWLEQINFVRKNLKEQGDGRPVGKCLFSCPQFWDRVNSFFVLTHLLSL